VIRTFLTGNSEKNANRGKVLNLIRGDSQYGKLSDGDESNRLSEIIFEYIFITS